MYKECCFVYSNTVYMYCQVIIREICFSAKIHSLVLRPTMHKTLVIDWLTYVQNILQQSFVAPSMS